MYHCIYSLADVLLVSSLAEVSLYIVIWWRVRETTFAMETQELGPFALLPNYRIFLTAVNNTNVLRSRCKGPDVPPIPPDFNNIWGFSTNFS
jgi:hypothetical protein